MTKKITIHDLCLMAIFTALFVVGAFINVPLPFLAAPISMQTFFVLLAAMMLRPLCAAVSFLVYLLLGLAGLPVFTAGGGISYVFKPSFGFLLGMLLAIPIMSFLIKKIGQTWKGLLISGLAGTLIIYLVGVPYMYLILKLYLESPVASVSYVLINGCLMFLPGDLIKLGCSATVAKRMQPLMKYLRPLAKRI